jgi:hypothetical protein
MSSEVCITPSLIIGKDKNDVGGTRGSLLGMQKWSDRDPEQTEEGEMLNRQTVNRQTVNRHSMATSCERY